MGQPGQALNGISLQLFYQVGRSFLAAIFAFNVDLIWSGICLTTHKCEKVGVEAIYMREHKSTSWRSGCCG
jgi:hypothetical protein